MKLVVITCGPSYEPIDQVRRITNHSTGKLGIVLSNAFARAGFDVLCLKGVGATEHEPLRDGVRRLPFSTNDHLLERLESVARQERPAALLHAAALCDFKVKQTQDASGAQLDDRKLSSRSGDLIITLTPARKVIGELRALFPNTRIAGWKYEVAGTREEVVRKGARQITENRTDLCVLNGSAYGKGFGVLRLEQPLMELNSRETLASWLIEWVSQLS